MEDKKAQNLYSLDRIKGLSDGTIAIALTLLVLAIDIPENHDFTQEGLTLFLKKLEPSFVAYFSSFVLIAIYWMQQHSIFRFLKYSNRTFEWINIIFLFAITLAPFMSKIKTLYRYDANIVMMFAITNIFAGLVLFGMWQYVLAHPEMHDGTITSRMKTNMKIRTLLVPFISLIAIPLAFINVHVGTYIFSSVPIIYIALIRLDR